ncbi:hypothetical protein JI741_17410 [Chryseolinea sp. Jin1]|uniref:Uncharacterized protein n=1 Tax=Chryseolinea lacunae TaxID=2801331 RepID=A0ABS1KU83_9BACT|nr:hypothetical protein [Chryseolinea lacunae]
MTEITRQRGPQFHRKDSFFSRADAGNENLFLVEMAFHRSLCLIDESKLDHSDALDEGGKSQKRCEGNHTFKMVARSF